MGHRGLGPGVPGAGLVPGTFRRTRQTTARTTYTRCAACETFDDGMPSVPPGVALPFKVAQQRALDTVSMSRATITSTLEQAYDQTSSASSQVGRGGGVDGQQGRDKPAAAALG
jgi:hypothetical protein